jgi:glycosyltransferase involved in cell wall biosynthesis
MWSRAGSGLLSRRTNRAIRAAGDRGPFLQVGTLVELDPDFGPHYTLVDMTIPQARRAETFAIGHLSPARYDEAVGIQARVLRQAAHTFTLSDWARRSVIDDFGIDPDRVTTVYAGPNLRIPPSLTDAKAPREILFVGIDWERKGGPLLADAFSLLRRRLPDATLRVVGCTPDVRTPGVHVEGFLDRRDPAQFERLCRCYLRASCFCLPSLFEPFGVAIVEAATAGLPVVSVDTGSRREAVAHGTTGVLAPERTPAALADALYDVLADPARAQAMGQAARTRAQSLFTWDRAITQILQIARAVPVVPCSPPSAVPARLLHPLRPTSS